MTESTVSGTCMCKAHSFSIEASKIRFGFASCHCSICRQSHAAPFVMWAGMNADCSTPDVFLVTSKDSSSLTGFRTSSSCTRYFCSTCGTHLYIKYDSDVEERWAGEVHFPTALLDVDSLRILEEAMTKAGRPRYLHVFANDRNLCIGDMKQWATAPKYGGETGLEPLEDSA